MNDHPAAQGGENGNAADSHGQGPNGHGRVGAVVTGHQTRVLGLPETRFRCDAVRGKRV